MNRMIHAIVLAGGTGERLGHVSKADLVLGGRRLIDLVVDQLGAIVTGRIVVVAPSSVVMPVGVHRTMEDPPGGGPLAGIDAGLALVQSLGGIGTDDMVVICGVDTPAIGELSPRLADALDAHPDADAAVIHGGSPQSYRQYLQGIYRMRPLSRLLSSIPTRDRGVRRSLHVLSIIEVPAQAEDCRDLDSPEDLKWWRSRITTDSE